MANLRDNIDAQKIVESMTIQGKSVTEITKELKQKFGKAYRKQNLLEDMRTYSGKKIDKEITKRKYTPRKYVKDYILMLFISILPTFRPIEEVNLYDILVTEEQKEENIQELKRLMEVEPTKSYWTLEYHVGKEEDLKNYLEIIKESSHVDAYSIISSDYPNQVIVTSIYLLNQIISQINPSWQESLRMTLHSVKNEEYRNHIRRLFQ